MYFRDQVDVPLRVSGTLRSRSHEIAEAWRPCGPDGGADGSAAPTNRSCATDFAIDRTANADVDELIVRPTTHG